MKTLVSTGILINFFVVFVWGNTATPEEDTVLPCMSPNITDVDSISWGFTDNNGLRENVGVYSPGLGSWIPERAWQGRTNVADEIGNLEILNLKISDDGIYHCRKSSRGSGEEADTELVMYETLKNMGVMISFSNSSEEFVTGDKSVDCEDKTCLTKLTCSVTSHPAAALKWDTEKLPLSDTICNTTDYGTDCSLTVQSIESLLYTCIAEYSYSEIGIDPTVQSIKITVRGQKEQGGDSCKDKTECIVPVIVCSLAVGGAAIFGVAWYFKKKSRGTSSTA